MRASWSAKSASSSPPASAAERAEIPTAPLSCARAPIGWQMSHPISSGYVAGNPKARNPSSVTASTGSHGVRSTTLQMRTHDRIEIEQAERFAVVDASRVGARRFDVAVEIECRKTLRWIPTATKLGCIATVATIVPRRIADAIIPSATRDRFQMLVYDARRATYSNIGSTPDDASTSRIVRPSSPFAGVRTICGIRAGTSRRCKNCASSIRRLTRAVRSAGIPPLPLVERLPADAEQPPELGFREAQGLPNEPKLFLGRDAPELGVGEGVPHATIIPQAKTQGKMTRRSLSTDGKSTRQ